MYEERSSNLKDVVLKILFTVLLIFIIIWLFPTKSYVSNLIDKKLGTKSYQTFNENIGSMKDAALSYYNGDRLPSALGDKSKLTLKEMLDKNLLVPFTDSNDKKCDTSKSYAEITKQKSDYSLKVNLVCSDKSAYVISYVSDYSYCSGEVCEKKKLTDDASDASSLATTETSSDTNNDVSSSEPSECKYVKRGNGYWGSYGAWSSWSQSKVTASNSREVQTKTEKTQVSVALVQDGTTKVTTGSRKILVTQGGVQKYLYICPSDYDNGGSYDSYQTCVKTTIKYRNAPVYKNLIYYRYRDRKYVSANDSYVWSSCDDSALLNKGYVATGDKR